MPYIEQGERDFAFRITAGTAAAQQAAAPRMAQQFNMPPMALSFYPSGAGEKPAAPLRLADTDTVQWTTLKAAEDQNGWVVRLFNPVDTPQTATLWWGDASCPLAFGAYEIKTVRIVDGVFTETDLTEQAL